LVKFSQSVPEIAQMGNIHMEFRAL